jgi:hypothetical protein
MYNYKYLYIDLITNISIQIYIARITLASISYRADIFGIYEYKRNKTVVSMKML